MEIKLAASRSMVLMWGGLAVLLVTGFVYAAAMRAAPSEHKGVNVTNLGLVSEASLNTQIGLSGYVMQMREITLEPGGEIARHDHYQRPGLVLTLSGSWVEGRAGGEIEYPSTDRRALVEDADTEHWFFNDSSEPVKVVTCDIVPAQ